MKLLVLSFNETDATCPVMRISLSLALQCFKNPIRLFLVLIYFYYPLTIIMINLLRCLLFTFSPARKIDNMLIMQQYFEFQFNEKTTRKNAQVVTSLQTSCHESVHKLSTSCVRTACSQL
jgi:hypothetical protein